MIRLYPNNKKHLEIRLTDRSGAPVNDAEPTVTFLSQDKSSEPCPAISALQLNYRSNSRGVYEVDVPANHAAPYGDAWLRFAATDIMEDAACLVEDREKL